MPNPWFTPGGYNYIPKADKIKADQQTAVAAAKALEAQQVTKPKKSGGIFGFLGDAKDAVIGGAEDVAGAIGTGLNTWGNQLLTAPAEVSTKGIYTPEGGYQSRFHLGNPISNIKSHLRAQEQAGYNTHGFLNSIKASNRIGKSFSENPDIPAGVKFATQVGLDPTTYLGLGIGSAISKTAKGAEILAQPGVGGTIARGAVGLTKGFENPASAAKFAIGGGVATEIADRTDAPGPLKLVAPILGAKAAGLATGGLHAGAAVAMGAVPGELRGLSNEELGAIARDRNNPLRQKAMELLTKDFKNTTNPTERQSTKIADIPSMDGNQLRDAARNPSVGSRFKKAVLDEITRRSNPNRLGVVPEEGEITPGELGASLPASKSISRGSAIPSEIAAGTTPLESIVAEPIVSNTSASATGADTVTAPVKPGAVDQATAQLTSAQQNVLKARQRLEAVQATRESLGPADKPNPYDEVVQTAQKDANAAEKEYNDLVAHHGTDLGIKVPDLGPPTKGRALGALGSVNNAVRSLNTVFDIAALGRLGRQAGARWPTIYAKAAKVAASSIFHPEAVEEIHNGIDQRALEANASAGAKTRYTVAEMAAPVDKGGFNVGRDIGDTSPGLLGKIPGPAGKVASRVVGVQKAFLDTLRPLALEAEIENRSAANPAFAASLSDPAVRKDLGRGVNLLTGQSSHRFGPNAGLVTEFPNWLAAQGELLYSAFQRGSITSEMARNSLLKLVGIGTIATAGLQLAQGKSPLSNIRGGVPQANIPGTDLSWDMYGPLGEVISKFGQIAQAGVQGAQTGGVEGTATGVVGKTLQQARGYAAPLLSQVITQSSGSDFVGNRVKSPEERITSLIQQALPFNAAGAIEGREPAAQALGLVGERVHQPSPLNQALYNAGIKSDDLLGRKAFLQQHPELRGNNALGDLERQTQQRRDALNQATISDPTITLKNFKDARTTILQDQRSQLKQILGDKQLPVSGGKQGQWLHDYYNLFTQAHDPTDPNPDSIDANKLDTLIADWSNKPGNEGALDFVNQYTNTGLGPVETAYLNDLRSLDAEGYFKLPHLQHMRSGLPESAIMGARGLVENYRQSDPNLQRQPMIVSAREALNNIGQQTLDKLGISEVTPELIADVANVDKQAYQNPDFRKFADTHRQQLMWFDQRANWASYLDAVNGKAVRNPSTPGGGGNTRGHVAFHPSLGLKRS